MNQVESYHHHHVVLVTGAGGYLGQCLIHTMLLQSQQQSPQTSPQTTIHRILMADIYFPTTFHFPIINELLSLSQQQPQSQSPPPPPTDTTTTTTTTTTTPLLPVLQLLKGDISDPTYCDSLFHELIQYPTTISTSSSSSLSHPTLQVSMFHMGGVMSGDGERDFDLCMNVNLFGTIHLFERTRQLTQQYYDYSNEVDTTTSNTNIRLVDIPKFIFCSAGAIIGAGDITDYIQGQDIISDQCRATPHSTYGMTKACCELLLSDYTRRNFIDGRAIRLPTIIVRAGLPNAATTSCYSSIIRESLAGHSISNLPIDPHVSHAVTSTRAAIHAILHFYHTNKEQVDTICGYDRTIFIPATSVTLHELHTTLLQKVIHNNSHSLLGKMEYQIDHKISNMVGSFPHQINPYCAIQLGIPSSPNIETMIREYIADFPKAIIPNLQILPPLHETTNTTTNTNTPTTTTTTTEDITGKRIAVITGAGSGIGRAVAQRLVKSKEWIVVLTGRTRKSLLDTQQLCNTNDVIQETTNTTTAPTLSDLQLIQNNCLCIPTDVTIEADVIRLFDTIKERFGRIDLLFNNAGINSTAASIEQVTLQDFERVLTTNVTGPFLCAREAIKIMSQQQPPLPTGGRIINNGSLSSQVPRPHSTTYTTSKHALSGLTKCIALDGRKYNIACGQVDFGNIVTELSLNTNKPNVGALQANGITTMIEPSMNVHDAAETIYMMANLPLEANILQMTVMATTMPFVGRG